MTSPSRRSLRLAILVALLTAATAMADLAIRDTEPGSAQTRSPQPDQHASPGAVRQKSATLAAAAEVQAAPDRPYFEAGDPARAEGRRRASTVPLPDGGNFNGIQWDAVDGGLSDADIEFVLQYNAMCQWVRARADDRDADVSEQVLRDAADWAAIRGAGLSGRLHRVLPQVGANATSDAAALVTECQASADSERRYAASRGLQPTG